MSRRMLLMFALLLVSTIFYTTVTHLAAPGLVEAGQSQIELLNQIDEIDRAMPSTEDGE